MSDDIVINIISNESIVTNFSSQTDNVTVDLIQANHTIEIVGNPSEISTNVVSETVDVYTSPQPVIEVSVNRNGLNGLSAYEIAVNNGFIGTEEEWLASIGSGGGQYVTLSALKSDDTNIIYAGISSSIIDTDQPIWLIYKLDLVTNIVTYADGNLNYDNIWELRETLIYI